ncbi:hypothetical protein DAEQUDRAFT_643964, partial [Daedalea quercina L-15889]
CTICLGWHLYVDIAKCRATTMWDGAPVLCKRNSSGQIVNRDGEVICLDFQRPSGCSSNSPKHLHQCS